MTLENNFEDKEYKTEICRWKLVANNDIQKKQEGLSNITFSQDKPCYNCNGSKYYAEEINCKFYYPKKNKLKNEKKI